MTDYDEFDATDDQDARDEVRQLVRGRGLKAAVAAAIAVAEDETALPRDRVTAAGLLFRVGMLDKAADEPALKEPHLMEPDELRAHVEKLRRKSEALEARARGEKNGVFE